MGIEVTVGANTTVNLGTLLKGVTGMVSTTETVTASAIKEGESP